MLALSAPGTLRQADPGGSMTSQQTLLGDPRVPVSKHNVTKMTSVIDLWPLSMYLCTLVHMHVYLHGHKITKCSEKQDLGVRRLL